MQKKHVALGYLVGAVCLYFAFRGISFRELAESFSRGKPEWILLAVLIAGGNYVIRAQRWALIIKPIQAIPGRLLFWPMTIGFFANNVLPFRMGELVRAHICGKKFHIPRTAALGSIFLERICDSVAFLMTFVVVSFFYPFPAYMKKGAVILGGACLLVIGTLIVVRRHELRFRTLLGRSPLPAVWKTRIDHLVTHFIHSTSGITQPRYVAEALLLSFIVWTVEGTFLYLMTKAFAVPMDYGQAFFLLFALGLSVALPQAPGYVGTYEFFGVTALAMLGIAKIHSLPLILAIHGTQFILVGILGLIGLWKEGLTWRSVASTA